MILFIPDASPFPVETMVILSTLASGADMREALHLANRAAGIVVGKLGTAVVTPEELEEAYE